MADAFIITNGKFQPLYDGAIVPGGQVYFYEGGTTTPLDTYADSTQTAANTNPVILNAQGYAPIYLKPGTRYKVRLDDANDVTLWTEDNILAPLAQADIQTLINNSITATMPSYATKSALEAATVAAGVDRVRILGYATEEDEGGGEYVRVSSQPSHGLRIRSTDRQLPDSGGTDNTNGGWWEWAEPTVTPFAVGGVGNGVTDDAARIDVLNDSNSPAKSVDLLGRTWEYGGTFSRVSSIHFFNGQIVDDSDTHSFWSLKTIEGVPADISGEWDASDLPTSGSMDGDDYVLADVNGVLKRVSPDVLLGAASLSGAVGYAIFSHKANSGTSGGTPTASVWNTRAINTVDVNNISGASLASNQITLPAGTYFVEWWASGGRGASVTHQTRLRNVSDGTNVAIGSSEFIGGDGSDANTMSMGSAVFSLAEEKIVRLEHWFNKSQTHGMGTPTSSGAGELYAQLILRKLT